MKRRFVYILLLCLLAAHPTHAQQEAMQYSIRHYSSANGLSQNTVMSILQDADGFIWLGTWDGLNRFDGHEFKTYKPSLAGSQVASNRVDYLYEDSLHFIWMNTNDGGFSRLNKHTEHILSTEIRDTRFGNCELNGHNILEQRAGIIWLAGGNQLLRIYEKTGKYSDDIERKTFTLAGDVNCMVDDADNKVWVGTPAGLECFDGDNQQLYKLGETAEDNHITVALRQDDHLWFGSHSGALWRYSTVNHKFELIRIGVSSPITHLTILDSRTVIICTEGEGFVVYDASSGKTTTFCSANSNAITNNTFLGAFTDSHHNVWLINQEAGVVRFSSHEGTLQRYVSQPDSRYKNLQFYNLIYFEDNDGNVWLNPYGGGFCVYNYQRDEIINLFFSGVSNIVHSAFLDRDDNLWLGSYDSGLDCISGSPKKILLTDLRKLGDQSAEVRAVYQLHNGHILIASQEGIIREMDDKGELIGQRNLRERVYCMIEAADGTIYYGTKGGGIIKQQGHHTSKMCHDDNMYSLLSDNVYDMVFGADSTLYVATYGGGINILRNGKFIHKQNDWIRYPSDFGSKVRQLCFANDSILWAATTNGLLRVNVHTLETQRTPFYDLRAVYRAIDGHMWLGSFGGGMIEVSDPLAEDIFAPENIRAYTSIDGLRTDIVLSIVGDENGGIWASDEEGISHLDRNTSSFRHFNAMEESEKAAFSEAKGILLRNGNLMFGYSFGTCSFNPDRISHSDRFPQIRFTGLQVMNQPVEIGKGPIADNICYRPQIRLRHSETVFTIEYTAIDYPGADRIHYAYRLEGSDKGWNYVEDERRVTYSGLSAGDYLFHVKSTNSDGIWGDNEQTIKIHIAPSFWATPWAFMIYLIVLILICFLAYNSFTTTYNLRQEVAVEQKVTEIKLRFFTNISHELRTPLTLISGPVETVLRSDDITPAVRTQLEIVSSNANRMLRLINQILDFRKIQNNQMRLRIQHTDVVALAKATFGNFRKEASDKRIDFRFEVEATDPMAWVDKEKVDTIIYNLLSNAFKFTPAGKSITLCIAEKPNFIIIRVSDTGIGIPKDKRSVLFQRFSSHNEINAEQEKAGTGIGLNLVKELVDLQKGYIEVESEVGNGTTFSIALQRDRDHFGSEANVVVDDKMAFEEAAQKQEESVVDVEEDEKKNILVVDDNGDMRIFLQRILTDDYRVFQAADGEEAFAMVKQTEFALIITDLMMPNVDGLQLTEQLKSDMATSHVPVILLTAKSAIESHMKALEYGADDYITKPFSPEFLLARIDNIIRQRERLQATYRAAIITPESNVISDKPETPNEIFLHKLYQFMMDNIDNNDLSVDNLVKEMALGRTVFFNKLKGLTGLSPVEYIRDVRIKRAAELLLDGRYNVTEVTYMVGMNDSRYFAKCFKAAYGVTPTEYKKEHSN